jgi:glycosyltransferase involved in cell wall biosynthesis
VVGTLGNGIEDAVKDGFNGLLVSQNNVTKTAETIFYIISDTETSKTFSENSYKWATEHSLVNNINKYINIYYE